MNEIRIIDCDYFAETENDLELKSTLERFLDNGWTVLKIFEPMEYKGSKGDYFCRVIFQRIKIN